MNMKSKISILLLSVSLLCMVSCDDWLNVSSNSEVNTSEQFSNAAGYKDALTGVYILLARPALYGKNMTWGCMDFLAQQYMAVSGANNGPVAKFQWESTVMKGYVNTLWSSEYNAIANINNILRWIDRTGKDVLHPVQDSVIRGECLALRAYLHLDLMRVYGKGNLGNRPHLNSELTVPYVTEFTKETTFQRNYTETFKLLFADIEEALKYLEADPLKSVNDRPDGYYDAVASDNFISTNTTRRRKRMNYYSCLALYARALMWEGSEESRTKALEVANMVINQEDITASTRWYSWITSSGLASDDYLQRDNAFMYEHLWSLNVDNFLEVQKTTYDYSWFDAHSPNNTYEVAFLTERRAKGVYEVENGIVSDWRYTKGLIPEGPSLNNYAITKYRDQIGQRKSETYRNRIPMLRITEMFYIAAECLADSDPARAMLYLNTVRHKRNIPENLDLKDLSPDQIRDEIKKEYMKEFVAEGQLFFYYKRLGAESILDYPDPMTDLQYVFPLPDNEIINGGREQTKVE